MTTGEPDAPLTHLPASQLQVMTHALSPFILSVAGPDNYKYLCTDLSIS